jgi:prepilin-type N-terminal cleavage/methylation domain-containing protein
MVQRSQYQRGLTLLEILMTIALISIILSITIIAVNPNRQLGQSRDAVREVDTEKIYEAVQRYAVDTGRYPENVRNLSNRTEIEICVDGTSESVCDSNGLLFLESDLVPGYLPGIPTDPSLDDGEAGTGYVLYKDDNGKIGVRSQNSETDAQSIFAGVPTTYNPAWFDSFDFRRVLTIESDEVSGSVDLTNFPVLVSMTLTDLATVANGGNVQSANGYDIVFTDNDNTQLDHEIELYNPVSGQIVMWVHVPILGATADTEIRMYYGDNSITVSQENVDGVWDANYAGVWHMAEDPSVDTDGDCSGGGFELCDSTANGNHGNAQGNFTGGELVGGQIGNAISFDGSSEYFVIPYSSSIDVGGTELTVEAYGYGSQPFDNDAPYLVKGPGMNTEQYMLGVNNFSSGTNDVDLRVTTSTQHYRYDEGTKPSNVWTYSVMKYDDALSSGQELQLFIDGSQVFQTAASGTINQSMDVAHIGKRLGGDNRHYAGQIDEIRLSNVARSNEWITTTYNNLSGQGVGVGQFISSIGSAEPQP